MAHTDREHTPQLDSLGQEPHKSSQGVGGADVKEEVRIGAGDADAGKGSLGDGQHAKEVGSQLQKPSSPFTIPGSVSDRADNPSTRGNTPSSTSPPVTATVAPTPTRPTLVQLNSSQTSSSSLTVTAVPPTKKFSSVNINKKFLEKTSSASAAANSSSAAANASKIIGNNISRPPTQSSSPHPRLVTTKLTASATSPSTTAGWSRPSSTAPPASATGTSSPSAATPISSAPIFASTSLNAPTPAAPQLPHVGKVIQPVPRAVLSQQVLSTAGAIKDGASTTPTGASGKPVWGNVKPPSANVVRSNVATSDFPTAAEVAQGSRKNKSSESPVKEVTPAPSTSSTSKSRSEEADTFRGVHLDPNAHHWDEMEEDDDNFLDGVIEFGDGRQYKVETTEHISTSREPSPPSASKSSQIELHADVPISKEDRFADDFDRSWPNGAKRGTTTGTLPHSPQESARVLFNERSNKLEPYSNHRLGHGPFPGKRGTLQERTISPVEPRSTSGTLPKPGAGGSDFGSSSRARRFSSSSNASFTTSNDRQRDRRDGIPPSPRMTRDAFTRSVSTRGRDREGDRDKVDRDFGNLDRGRRSTMGPSPVPAHALRDVSRESSGRQLPPHLSTPGSATSPLPTSSFGRRASHGSRFDPPFNETHTSDLHRSTSVTRGPPHSPALSQVSLKSSALSPASPSLALPLLAGHDLEELKKDVMQNAAVRAKQRRQQEEEEREAQKQRARKKAAELEAKMKVEAEEKAQREKEAAEKDKEEMLQQQATEEAKDTEVISIIQEAVESIETGRRDDTQTSESSSKAPLRRPSSLPLQPSGDVVRPRRPGPSSGSVPPSAAENAETWRRTTPLPRQLHESRPTARRSSSSVAFIPPSPADIDHIQLADTKKEDLEVVDFIDMGKLVGETTDATPNPEQDRPKRTLRPVASDFFDDTPPAPLPTAPMKHADPWRRRTSSHQISASEERDTPLVHSKADNVEGEEHGQKPNESSNEARQYHHTPPAVMHPVQQRTNRMHSYYIQAPMSSLVDAMSRIKGALHDMHAEELNKENIATEVTTSSSQAAEKGNGALSKPAERWVPPSLRGRTGERQEPSGNFSVTITEPPQSPAPISHTLVVRLPSVLQEREPINKKRLQWFLRSPPPVRWDILSFDPPVEGMNRRDFSLNDVLFRRPYGAGFKGKLKYRVFLPRGRSYGPRVHIPNPNALKSGIGAFGKQAGADSSLSWRKTISPLQPTKEVGAETAVDLDTTSRSPPPEAASTSPTFAINSKVDDGMADGSPVPVRVRSQPKMPAGSGVAFYRDSRIDAVEAEPRSLVNFIVSSEIDDPQSPQQPTDKDQEETSGPSKTNITKEVEQSATIAPRAEALVTLISMNGMKEEPTTYLPEMAMLPVKPETKSSEKSTAWTSSRNLSVKESSARAPDPEHLKAVWSQTSDKAGLPSVNSLEGIADDLTTLPFTIQDVKSEGGETPPPVSATSSRMSIHDVTRAFQQVPQSSTSTSHRPPISPPSTTAPVARPNSYTYAVPPSSNIRPTYPPYPSPMMSHSPSPTVMYPHMVSSPVPARMQPNGHAPAPMYGQLTWVPVPGPTPQNSAGMMRHMATAYPPQMMYTPNGVATMYASPVPPNMIGTPQPQNNMQGNRNRNVSMMSPVMQHASPHMYPASPALVHMQVVPNSGYMPLSAGRGQTRHENGQMGVQQHPPNSAPSSSHLGFSAVPPSPYARPTW
ncbi:hypothetical protein AMATHDRAFT_5114 [Amanita thiersii Skay4041]|uniref:Uncharacterized protein n=1 Tax=Amanita thiersii Skay4041 TaxID=703135 RepID=A0A2A9NNA4_9AGAR|nr:hypothetical protein AMATHDRAFT_5114 [Amanita thiersii Skay4041]